jgi:hypothetical protein
MKNRPPRWAEGLLRLVLQPADRECVSGDLLEEYRAEIVPLRGARSADLWYTRQVAGYLWRATRLWAIVFSAAFLARTAYDWLVPTTDFVARSTATTIGSATMLLLVGFGAAWRARSPIAGVVVAAMTSQVAAVFSVVGATFMLGAWHDTATMRAIAGSGGLGEVYTLPFLAIVPATVLGGLGGTLASVVGGLRSGSGSGSTRHAG